MDEKLLIGILGKSKSGKSYTWDKLFGRNVKTGKNLRRLYFDDIEYEHYARSFKIGFLDRSNIKPEDNVLDVGVFLLSRSPQKRHIGVELIIKDIKPKIVLCSMQYVSGVKKTFSYFVKNGFSLFIHWLNPGYSDNNDSPLFYNLGIINHILSLNSIVGVRNGKLDAEKRIDEIKDYIYGWAKSRDLIKKKRIRKTKHN